MNTTTEDGILRMRITYLDLNVSKAKALEYVGLIYEKMRAWMGYNRFDAGITAKANGAWKIKLIGRAEAFDEFVAKVKSELEQYIAESGDPFNPA